MSKLGVDVIEAGFPVASPDDLAAVKLIAQEVGNDVQADGYVPVICAMARTVTKDLDRWVGCGGWVAGVGLRGGGATASALGCMYGCASRVWL